MRGNSSYVGHLEEESEKLGRYVLELEASEARESK